MAGGCVIDCDAECDRLGREVERDLKRNAAGKNLLIIGWRTCPRRTRRSSALTRCAEAVIGDEGAVELDMVSALESSFSVSVAGSSTRSTT